MFAGGIAQLGERLHGMQEVSGSIPLTSTRISSVQVLTLSSRGLGHHPFTVSTGVRIPVGTPKFPAFAPNISEEGVKTANEAAEVSSAAFSLWVFVVLFDQLAMLIQFSVSSAGTRSNSFRLFVTSTSPSLRA